MEKLVSSPVTLSLGRIAMCHCRLHRCKRVVPSMVISQFIADYTSQCRTSLKYGLLIIPFPRHIVAGETVIVLLSTR